MTKHTKVKILLSLIIVAITATILYYEYYSLVNTPVDKEDTENISVQIKKGATSGEIADNLEEKGLIESSIAFRIYARIHGLSDKMLFGRFVLNKTMNVPQIIATLSDPSKVESVITIQEGLTIKDIDKKLVELGLISPNDFINEVKKFNGWEYYSFLDKGTLEKLDLPLEGYLFPDTYFLDPIDFKPHDLIYLAIDNFEKKFTPVQKDIKNRTVHEIVTMASIIEKEVRSTNDRKLVSGILWKRLENDWTLGADATLIYIKNDLEITQEDLNLDSPYNTRTNKGLPPGPISNPSLDSILAAINPEKSDYWFYLTDKEGKVIYGKTNEEHNLNKEKYL